MNSHSNRILLIGLLGGLSMTASVAVAQETHTVSESEQRLILQSPERLQEINSQGLILEVTEDKNSGELKGSNTTTVSEEKLQRYKNDPARYAEFIESTGGAFTVEEKSVRREVKPKPISEEDAGKLEQENQPTPDSEVDRSKRDRSYKAKESKIERATVAGASDIKSVSGPKEKVQPSPSRGSGDSVSGGSVPVKLVSEKKVRDTSVHDQRSKELQEERRRAKSAYLSSKSNGDIQTRPVKTSGSDTKPQ